mmetsp:Transcript_88100/g.189108  ORF Transcript_88100/g.189108 Transcript_88100/m.189108 type:complete len:206 (+) Transcript_88100:1332-1949(+)
MFWRVPPRVVSMPWASGRWATGVAQRFLSMRTPLASSYPRVCRWCWPRAPVTRSTPRAGLSSSRSFPQVRRAVASSTMWAAAASLRQVCEREWETCTIWPRSCRTTAYHASSTPPSVLTVLKCTWCEAGGRGSVRSVSRRRNGWATIWISCGDVGLPPAERGLTIRSSGSCRGAVRSSRGWPRSSAPHPKSLLPTSSAPRPPGSL